MKKGFTYMIEHFRSCKDATIRISAEELASAFRYGICAEPNKLPELVKEYESLLARVWPNMPFGLRRCCVLENVSGWAFMADHYRAEVVARAMLGGPKTVHDYYSDPQHYGPAMNAIADYVGFRGPALSLFLSMEQDSKIN